MLVPASSTTVSRGVITSVASSVVFGVIFFITPFLAPLPAEAIWAIRASITIPFVAIILQRKHEWHLVTEIARRIPKQWWLLPALMVLGLNLAAQVWLFSWAPLNGRGLQVALGYFLLPLVLVLAGKLIFKDKLAWWQWAAAGIASIGVGYEVIRVGGIGWETLLVAVGYAAYFVLRRIIGTSHLGGMFWELCLMAPVAIAVGIWQFGDGMLIRDYPGQIWASVALSIIAALALVLYLVASRLLPMGLFGLLGYLEPALLLIASLLIGEFIGADEWFTYGAIWSAVLVLCVGGFVDSKKRPATEMVSLSTAPIVLPAPQQKD